MSAQIALSPNALGEYLHDPGAPRLSVVKPDREFFNPLAILRELNIPTSETSLRPFCADQIIQCCVANLALDDVLPVHHCETEQHFIGGMTNYFASSQRHRPSSPSIPR
jgi:hypothetical protein